jgi:hypothetical protein
MAKDKISDYSSTANSNTDIAGINIDEGCAPSGINDAIRTLMAQLKTWQSGGQDVYIHPAGSASAPSITANGDTNTGIFFPAADTVGITTGGTERARVDSSGNLGLGVTPSAWASSYKALDVGNTASFYFDSSGAVVSNNSFINSSFQYRYKTSNAATRYEQTSAGQHQWFNAASGTAGNAISFTQAMTLDASGNLGVGTTSPSFKLEVTALKDNVKINASQAGQMLAMVQSSANPVIMRMTNNSSNFWDTQVNTDNSISWDYNDTERARIDSSGNLLVGTTSGSQSRIVKSISGDFVLRVENSLSTNPYVLELMVPTASANDTSYAYWIARNANGTNRAYLNGNGGLANYSANNVNLSDRREKTNFAPATSYLDKICAIPVQTFNYIDQNLETDAGLTLGVVAQDVQAVAPELVTESNWGTEEEPKMRLSVYQTDLQYALMKCIQEQQAIIETLTARITALEQA